ncbi:DUF4266 domain-containing protein [Saccharicrinis sp. FJH2]|uniref:DUF4266 domain-containing protein n=1 Tax=unclassified Saccharicrinis TaxID=2646859 RepID=UPI0035D41598
MKKSIIKFVLLIVTGLLLFVSCQSVKSYQKVYLNDEEMELSARPLQYYESSFQTYREGSSGAEGGKTGGGCGCN